MFIINKQFLKSKGHNFNKNQQSAVDNAYDGLILFTKKNIVTKAHTKTYSLSRDNVMILVEHKNKDISIC